MGLKESSPAEFQFPRLLLTVRVTVDHARGRSAALASAPVTKAGREDRGPVFDGTSKDLDRRRFGIYLSVVQTAAPPAAVNRRGPRGEEVRVYESHIVTACV